MKHIKSFKLFESNWTKEEFISDLVRYLGQYNLTMIWVRDLISQLDIESEIENGKTPLQLSKEIISDFDLEERDKGGWMSANIAMPVPGTIKYL
jgi:hypothetical protein